MHDRITVPVANRLPGKVLIDRVVWERWNALGLPRAWYQSAQGPAYRDADGQARYVAGVILGRPYRLGKLGPNSIELENLQPLDGTPADTAGLDAMHLSAF